MHVDCGSAAAWFFCFYLRLKAATQLVFVGDDGDQQPLP